MEFSDQGVEVFFFVDREATFETLEDEEALGILVREFARDLETAFLIEGS